MPVALAPREPDACAHQRAPEHHRRAATLIPHRRPRSVPVAANMDEAPAPSNRTVPRHVQGTRP